MSQDGACFESYGAGTAPVEPAQSLQTAQKLRHEAVGRRTNHLVLMAWPGIPERCRKPPHSMRSQEENPDDVVSEFCPLGYEPPSGRQARGECAERADSPAPALSETHVVESRHPPLLRSCHGCLLAIWPSLMLDSNLPLTCPESQFPPMRRQVL